MRGYYFITDHRLSRAGTISDLEAALAAGARTIQYRRKDGSTRELLAEARQLRELCNGALFIVNDRVDIALAVDADGVHLGQDDLPYFAARRLLGREKIIGLTVHNVSQAREAQRWGANYVGVSPVFATATKEDAGEAAGVALIREISQAVTIPVIAIGGINLNNALQVIQAGADGICAISAVLTTADVKAEIEKFQNLFHEHFLKGHPSA
jgi:thiamine-phosphate pyrophosphorylase